MYSITVNVTNGVIQGVIWDNTCVFCGANNCRTYDVPGTDIKDQNCFNGANQATCISDPSSCDPVVYISWVGTDKDGLYMTSSSSKFSPNFIFSRQKVVPFHRVFGRVDF